MSQIKYLQPDEVLAQAIPYINFERQFTKEGKLYVEVTCPMCETKRELKVAVVRYRRHKYTAVCQKCSMIGAKDARPLKPDEVKAELWQYIDFNKQTLRKVLGGKKQRPHNALFIEVTCKQCKSKRWAHVASIRHHADTFTTLCRKCVNKGPNNPNWSGGRTIWSGGKSTWAGGGYIRLRIFETHPSYELVKSMIRADGSILEHRFVMAQKLGRPLERWELVHHINRNKMDNRPENLEIIKGHKDHYILTVAETEARKLREENKSLKTRIRYLEAQLKTLTS